MVLAQNRVHSVRESGIRLVGASLGDAAEAGLVGRIVDRIQPRRGSVQGYQLKQRLDVFRRGAAPKALEHLPDVGGYRNPLAGEEFVQGHVVVLTDAAAGHQLVGVDRGHMVRVGHQ